MILRNVLESKNDLLISDINVTLKYGVDQKIEETPEIVNSFNFGDLKRLVEGGHVKLIPPPSIREIVKSTKVKVEKKPAVKEVKPKKVTAKKEVKAKKEAKSKKIKK